MFWLSKETIAYTFAICNIQTVHVIEIARKELFITLLDNRSITRPFFQYGCHLDCNCVPFDKTQNCNNKPQNTMPVHKIFCRNEYSILLLFQKQSFVEKNLHLCTSKHSLKKLKNVKKYKFGENKNKVLKKSK